MKRSKCSEEQVAYARRQVEAGTPVGQRQLTYPQPQRRLVARAAAPIPGRGSGTFGSGCCCVEKDGA